MLKLALEKLQTKLHNAENLTYTLPCRIIHDNNSNQYLTFQWWQQAAITIKSWSLWAVTELSSKVMHSDCKTTPVAADVSVSIIVGGVQTFNALLQLLEGTLPCWGRVATVSYVDGTPWVWFLILQFPWWKSVSSDDVLPLSGSTCCDSDQHRYWTPASRPGLYWNMPFKPLKSPWQFILGALPSGQPLLYLVARAFTALVSQLEFNVPFQHKYGYIGDERS